MSHRLHSVSSSTSSNKFTTILSIIFLVIVSQQCAATANQNLSVFEGPDSPESSLWHNRQ